MPPIRVLTLLCSLALLLAGELRAQNTINGRVLDEAQRPVAGVEVLLHRVTTGSGGSVDTDTSDATGAFQLTAPPDADSAALYFVAVQSGGELFMGEMQRMPFPSDLEYIVEAGDDPVRFEAPPLAPEERRAGMFVIIAGVLMVAAVLVYVLRRRPPAYRRMLVELATTDNEKRRAELIARLKRDA